MEKKANQCYSNSVCHRANFNWAHKRKYLPMFGKGCTFSTTFQVQALKVWHGGWTECEHGAAGSQFIMYETREQPLMYQYATPIGSLDFKMSWLRIQLHTTAGEYTRHVVR